MANIVTVAASSSRFSSSTYDVFISHRGPDVKNTLASYLYRRLSHCGLRAFLDRDELEKGDTIFSQIELAIHGASIQIAILSPTYAESTWCLDELVLMKNSGAAILPIFFNVVPSEVRYTEKQGSVYAGALRKLQGKRTSDPQTGEEKPRYALETIQKWRAALSYVADLSGFVHSDKDDEGELLENVVEKFLKEVPKTPLDVAKYPTGLEIKLEEFKKTVLFEQQQESERVRTKLVGIVGIGGIGKTTLAKKFFNSERLSYKGSSFLSDVREAAARMSLNSLQSKLIKDLQHIDITIDRHNGIELLQKHLKLCHALIILDDVDDISQLDAFLPIKDILSPGSMILITSRDRQVLVKWRLSQQSIFHLKGLDTLDSQKLFCLHAFHEPLPPPEFADLVDRFVKACDGLPLSLKVFGAQVCVEKERSVWEEMLQELEKTLPTEIYLKLRISYDSLEPKDKEIFLDIACFFLGEDGDEAMSIWGKPGFRTLQDRCLVEVDENKIRMHDHIRDMGRNIAEEGSLPLRLWDCRTNSIDDWLEPGTTLVNEVRGIKMVRTYDDVFRHTDFWGWSQEAEMGHLSFSQALETRLRYLRLVVAEEGYLEDILRRVQSPHLIWLRWYRCNYSSLPDWIPMKNLRVLEVEGSVLNTLWPLQSQAVPLQLRELNIYAPLFEIPKSIGKLKYLERIAISHQSITSTSTASTLERLPDEFCNLLALKFLVFSDLSRMVLLPDRFGELTNLQYIELSRLASLQLLPNSFGNLKQLKHLSLSRASSLRMLPDCFGELTNLEYIDLYGTRSLQMLPNSFGNLSQLKHLSLECAYSLKMLPNSFGNLTRLSHLSLNDCWNLTVSQRTLGNITMLKYLDFSYCKQLKELPPQVANQRALQNLHVSATMLKEIPSDIVDLSNLEYLVLGSDLLEVLPPGLGDLKSLKRLAIHSAPQLKSLPDSIGLLTQLTELDIYSCGIEYLPRELLKMNNLEYLYIDDCPLREHPFTMVVEGDGEILLLEGERKLKKSSSSNDRCLLALKTLELTQTKLREVSFDEGVCPNLQRLTLKSCYELRQIGGLSGLETLTSLQALEVSECKKLQSISGLGKLTKLTELHVRGCESIPGLGNLTKLTELHVSGCESIPGLGKLTKLTILEVSRCEKLQSIPWLGQLTELTRLDVQECREIPELPGVEHMISLKRLDVGGCKKLQSIPSLGQLTKLAHLDVHGCSEILELPGVEHLISLERLDVGGCKKLQRMPGLGKLTNLGHLDVHGCTEILELPGVEHLISLKTIRAWECEKLQSIPRLGQLTELRHLDVGGSREIRELPGAEHLISLERLNVGGCEKLQSIPGLGKLTKLTELDISGCREIRELPGVEYLTSLELFTANGCEKLKSIPGLGQFTKELDISGCLEIQELPGVEHLTSLERLDVGRCQKLHGIRGLGQLTKLRHLDVHGCSKILELPGVEQLTSLVNLDVGGLKKLQSIPGLGQLTQMRVLNVSECYELRELPGVEDLMLLENLDARDCPKLQWNEGVVEQLCQQLNDGFIYERDKQKCSCLQFLQFPCMW